MIEQIEEKGAVGTIAPPLPVIKIGINATGTREESDSMGTIDVPADHYWGGPDATQPHPFFHR